MMIIIIIIGIIIIVIIIIVILRSLVHKMYIRGIQIEIILVQVTILVVVD